MGVHFLRWGGVWKNSEIRPPLEKFLATPLVSRFLKRYISRTAQLIELKFCMMIFSGKNCILSDFEVNLFDS